jgi:hypothetical protein
VECPIRKAYEKDCIQSPDARNLRVNANRCSSLLIEELLKILSLMISKIQILPTGIARLSLVSFLNNEGPTMDNNLLNKVGDIRVMFLKVKPSAKLFSASRTVVYKECLSRSGSEL